MSSAATKTFRFLTSAQIVRLHQTSVTIAEPSQPAMLESAAASPVNIKYYENEQNVFQLAAHLAEKIMKNHAYQDGNKRTAFVAADMFLRINGYQLQKKSMSNDGVNEGIQEAHVAVAANQWDAKQLGQYYESIAKPIESWTPEILGYRNAASEH